MRSRAQSSTPCTPSEASGSCMDVLEKHLCPEPGEGSLRLQMDLSVASMGSALLPLPGSPWIHSSPIHPSQGLTWGAAG